MPGVSFPPLYDPRYEHDNCGIGFVARINGEPGHDILAMALIALGNQVHRGAVAADANTGDGAGVLTQIPRAFFQRELERIGGSVNMNDIAVGMLFLPQDTAEAEASVRIITRALTRWNLRVLGWRTVPINDRILGRRAMEMMPSIRQVIIGRPEGLDDETYERLLFLARKDMEKTFKTRGIDVYIPSLSSRTIVYKGLLVGTHLGCFYYDLRDPLFHTALAVYHQRYSTNTFPTWERAQPFRMVSHNGEINTLQGNLNWTRARQSKLHFPNVPCAYGNTTAIVTDVIDEKGSDSAMFDNALEVLVMGGRDVRHAITMMVPEAWENIPDMNQELHDFYQYHACLMEPWDGPAALAFSDGHIVGTALDRNGLRPARYLVTEDGLVISGSEAGVVPIENYRIAHKGRLGPGQMIAVDTREGRFYTNDEVKRALASRQPYGTWLQQHLTPLPSLMADESGHATVEPAPNTSNLSTSEQQMIFGYTTEELSVVLKPMMRDGREPVGSMGDSTPLAVLSQIELGRPLFHFFKQRFAEVTNPPIDPLREALVMSLNVRLGARRDVLQETPEHAHLLRVASPILNDAQLAAIRANKDPLQRSQTLNAVMPITQGGHNIRAEMNLRHALERLCHEAEQAACDGIPLLIISDRAVDAKHAPIPSLLAVSAVHHHLIRTEWRGRVSLIVESGEPREVHHVACLIGYGAKAVNPYLALASVRDMAADSKDAIEDEAEQNFIHALEKGLLKIMSKMGISPLESYCGAQVFECIGLNKPLVESYFTGTPSKVGGIGFEKLARDVLARHHRVFAPVDQSDATLPHPGFYKFKKEGEPHVYSPPIVRAMHDAIFDKERENGSNAGLDSTGNVSAEGYKRYKVYADMVNTRPPSELRDLLEFVPAGSPIPIEEVEPIEDILRRFSTAAMSHGALSSEAHETLSIAMNHLGGMGNSGEGGEAVERYSDERNSRIKQVASGRFGVTTTYLVHADELQIKMAQGSKPGEGGHLPGHKVSEEIARIRHTTPGVPLISPPPHHDIYSIEDLAQLIYDLKQVNPHAFVSVKLVSTAGVGTIAAGVAKGYADIIHISGGTGGTGASPLSSIKHAGMAWELGLSETQQTLVLNELRGRVRLRADGGFQTGRDVVIAAMLGADEYSFGTAAMIAEGCRMARVCHNNSCPVGVATQRPELRARFIGSPESVMAFFRYLAHEVRETLALLGVRSLQEVIGRSDMLQQAHTDLDAAEALDLTPILSVPRHLDQVEIAHSGVRNRHQSDETLNDRLFFEARGVLNGRGPIQLAYSISNRDRTVGARLAGAVSQTFGPEGLPPDTIHVTFRGSSGQSFGAFNASGMTLVLIGEANDYVGKCMAGGRLVVYPGDHSPAYLWHQNVVAGNTILYGATGGELYLAGRAGERFAVRNSGATAVVEGLGDHGCEYMTGGTVVILGQTGYNFGAGMTGGVAYVLDDAETLEMRHNPELIQLDHLNAHDETRVRELLQQHRKLTGSAQAEEVLENWNHYRGVFWRVMPREIVARIEATNEGQEEDKKSRQVSHDKRDKRTHPVPA
jgi:glutamate synthase (ferredoxin)